MKTIICLSGKSNIGKTETIYKVWEKLNHTLAAPMKTANNGKEVLAKLMYKNHAIGIETFGDPNSKQSEWIEILIKEGCEIIVCASRSYGETVEIVENYANKNGYAIVWASPLFTKAAIKGLDHIILKELTADMIIELIKKCL